MYGDQVFPQALLAHEEAPPRGFSGISYALKTQWNSTPQKKFLILKIILIIIGLTLLALNAAFNLIEPVVMADCLRDYFQEWTTPINLYLKNNDTARDIIIAIASFLIDFNVLVVCLRWIFYGNSLRLFFVIIVFYAFRGILQRLFSLQFPDDYIFAYPGFPSLVVPYAPANDFFFSGHVGISTIIYLEFTKDKLKFLRYEALIAIFYEFFVLLVTRKHHFIDMAVGMITAHYIFIFGLWLDEYVRNSNYRVVQMMNSEIGSALGKVKRHDSALEPSSL